MPRRDHLETCGSKRRRGARTTSAASPMNTVKSNMLMTPQERRLLQSIFRVCSVPRRTQASPSYSHDRLGMKGS